MSSFSFVSVLYCLYSLLALCYTLFIIWLLYCLRSVLSPFSILFFFSVVFILYYLMSLLSTVSILYCIYYLYCKNYIVFCVTWYIVYVMCEIYFYTLLYIHCTTCPCLVMSAMHSLLFIHIFINLYSILPLLLTPRSSTLFLTIILPFIPFLTFCFSWSGQLLAFYAITTSIITNIHIIIRINIVLLPNTYYTV